MDFQQLPNHLTEFIKTDSEGNKFLELFESGDKDVNLKTDLNFQEISVTHKLGMINDFLKSKGITSIYGDFLDSYFRLKFSLDRKSRLEFVDIHRTERFEQNLERFGNFQNLTKDR